nr:hypothetical protein [Tanacetum cinerariifolium]
AKVLSLRDGGSGVVEWLEVVPVLAGDGRWQRGHCSGGGCHGWRVVVSVVWWSCRVAWWYSGGSGAGCHRAATAGDDDRRQQLVWWPSGSVE